MWAVTVLGTRMATSAAGANLPPDDPVSAMTATRWVRACSAARMTFSEFPLVEIGPRSGTRLGGRRPVKDSEEKMSLS
jgi:hypothetical protein